MRGHAARSAKRGFREHIQEAERFLNERRGKLRPEEEKQIREARRELDS
jgi:uridine kinase